MSTVEIRDLSEKRLALIDGTLDDILRWIKENGYEFRHLIGHYCYVVKKEQTT